MHYALKGSYPIETEEQFKTACDYFNKYINKFQPVERTVIAHNLEKRANDLDEVIEYDWINNYSRLTKHGSGYSPDFERNLKLRKEACAVEDLNVKLNENDVNAVEVLNKIASSKNAVSPKDMVELISEFDKVAGLEPLYDDRIYDPIFTVYGSNYNSDYDRVKVAQEVSNNDIIRAGKDKEFIKKMLNIFGKDFADNFSKHPIEIFSSMPDPEKDLIISKIKEIK